MFSSEYTCSNVNARLGNLFAGKSYSINSPGIRVQIQLTEVLMNNLVFYKTANTPEDTRKPIRTVIPSFLSKDHQYGTLKRHFVSVCLRGIIRYETVK